MGLLSLGSTGCQDLGLMAPDTSSINDPIIDHVELKNVSYGKEPLQKFDLYLPLSLEKNPAEVVVLLHGGGWVSGDKSHLIPTVDLLKKTKKNLAIVNLNYRIASDVGKLLPAQLADIQSAVQFLVKNSEKYNIKKKDYVIAGVSAGGHLALTHAYRDNQEQVVQAVVAASAPTELCIKELIDKSLQPNVQYLVGAEYEKPYDNFINASPYYLASFRSPRTILLYGEKDELVPWQHGLLLQKKLKALKVQHTYILYPGEPHFITPEKVTRNIIAVFQNKPAS
ncbi:alpha/beta hydrolase [Telluribacter sp.]|uniref:alpha/beta hydrolase n=1 Tax=Telluribacter sp. TaxID=1978767 RepID=UPI002E123C77|nr:alpha/beta hydrolase [Telluribacter sp.]